MKTFGKFVFDLLLLAILIFSIAFVGTHLWAWFIVPQFGLAAINMGEALGLSIVLKFFCSGVGFKTYKAAKERKDQPWGDKLKLELLNILAIWIALGLGYIYTLFL